MRVSATLPDKRRWMPLRVTSFGWRSWIRVQELDRSLPSAVNKSMHILHVVGARPNFMKAAPVYAVLAGYDHVRQTLVHSGQHYDFNMSDVFFEQLGLPAPDINLQVGSGS